ncbi:MAG TPA: FAD-dependent oxidoreductase [Acidobacteriaceae bacterium]
MSSIPISLGPRELRKQHISADLVVVGGGLSGVCSAITAARQGLNIVLVQDRPVLGGNASSEVRLWILGATSHMGNNNRWAREGGVIDEILVENLWRNPEGNPVILDSLLLEFVKLESRITLLLNTSVHELDMNGDNTIEKVRAFCSQNQILYTIAAPLFVDASGDGILGFLAGADFRMGAEASSEFNEALGPAKPEHELLGHSLYFYSRDTGQPVRYVPPAFALQDITEIPRFRELRVSDSGCRLWWLEYGGNLDTVYDTETIKWELWRVAYGVWNYIKNSGAFSDTENLTLEWMGTIPGKRESRRFIGDLILTQNDIIEQRLHEDAVSFGGWAIDLHPSDGVFSNQPSCVQWHSKGVYQIPYRTMYSRNVSNLFLTGRLISTTHIALGTTRVMATCAHNGQAVGMAAAICKEQELLPRDLLQTDRMHQLQQRLLRSGQYIPGIAAADPDDLARSAQITASSTLRVETLPSSGELSSSERPYALLLPAMPGPLPKITLCVNAEQATSLRAELWQSSRPGNTTPDVFLLEQTSAVKAGSGNAIELDFNYEAKESCHLFVIIPPIPHGALHLSTTLLPGLLTLSQKMNGAVAKSLVQTPPANSGVDTFAFWLPDRRPAARNLAVRFTPSLDVYAPYLVTNGFARPWSGTNAWVPSADDPTPNLHISWDKPQTLHEIDMTFDTDFDHPMESVLMTHPEHVMPACIRSYKITTEEGQLLSEVAENHQTRQNLRLEKPVVTSGIIITILKQGPSLSAIYDVRCY